jgi:hypothetical protein
LNLKDQMIKVHWSKTYTLKGYDIFKAYKAKFNNEKKDMNENWQNLETWYVFNQVHQEYIM